MHATDILSAEHRVIEQVIAALDVAAGRLDAGEPLRPGFLLDAVRFLRDFADGYHHAKEEGVLFVALVEAGMPAQAGPVAVMLAEHERARALTAALAAGAREYASGAVAVAPAVAATARDYAALLTLHIRKEDGILFPMAAHLLPERAHAALIPAFSEVEDARRELDAKESFVALARTLAVEMGVDPDTLPRASPALTCHAA